MPAYVPARRWRRPAMRVTAVAAVVVAGTGSVAAYAAVSGVPAGPRANGTAVTPLGYRVTPAGTEVGLGSLPLDSLTFPGGKHIVVVNAGNNVQSLQVIDVGARTVSQTIAYPRPQAVYGGIAFSPDGRTLYVSGGGSNVVHTYAVAADDTLTETAPISLPVPTAAAGAPKPNPFVGGLDVTPDGKRLVVADQLDNLVNVVDLASGAVTSTAVGHRPYGVTVSTDGTSAWVSDQGAQTLDVVSLAAASPAVTGQVTVGTHPSHSILDRSGSRLFVANGDSDTISVVDTASNEVIRTISLAPYRNAEVGTNPIGLTLSEDEKTLYVANSGNNDVGIVDVASGRVRGTIPTGWYPTSVQIVGGALFITSGKGLGAGPNTGPGQPDPTATTPTAPDKYTGSMMQGLLTVVRVPSRQRLHSYTQQVERNNDVDSRGRQEHIPGWSVIPRTPGGSTPIKHVIYVVKENRTYDQVFGSLGRGNGDPSLNLFGDESAPNQRALSKKFVTFDNFYADAEVSPNGWNWVAAANSNPYAEQQWPPNYSGRGGEYPSENSNPATIPNSSVQTGLLWGHLDAAAVSFKNYGFFVQAATDGSMNGADPMLDSHTDHNFHGYDLSCPDSSGTFAPRKTTCGTPRVDEWLREFKAYEATDSLPAVQMVRMPNDHTSGTKPGFPTPRAYMADNDLAIGRLVEAVSHSKFWDSTAIFITEDDAQNGADHVDAHRTMALVVSPYTQRGIVDSTFYSTASMLATMEHIVGIKPMTQFDAFATPMTAAFGKRPDRTPYSVIVPPQDVNEVNTPASPLAAVSARQNLSTEDRIDEATFNEAIWKSIKGADSQMPAPKHGVLSADNDD